MAREHGRRPGSVRVTRVVSTDWMAEAGLCFDHPAVGGGDPPDVRVQEAPPVGITTSVRLPAVHPFAGMDVSTALADRARRFGGSRFLVWEPARGESRTWTYAEFARDVEATAAGLHAWGVREGDAVVLLLDNSPAFLFAWFACAQLGAVAVDMNTRYSVDELRHAIELTGAVGAVTHDHLAAAAREAMGDDRWIVTIDPDTGTCPALLGDPDGAPHRAPDPSAPLCVQFTSGTTSHPKAVLFTHANALWGGRVGGSHWRLTADDVVLVYAPLFHTAALSWQMLSTFWVGGTVVLMPKFTASRFWDISLRNGCTHTNVLGLMMQVLAEQPVPEHHYRSWQFGMEIPSLEERYGVRLFNGWGMTEVVTEVIIGDLGIPDELGAIGRVASEYLVRVVRDDGSDCDVGEVGDLLVGGTRGLSLFAEYYRDPAATADAFDEHGYFRTGDRVTVLPSGAIRFATRAKDMLKVGGENVAAVEIERVLMTVPGIAEAAAVGRRDRMLDEVPVAFVVLGVGADAGDVVEQALDSCRAKLADFKVPRDVYVVDDLPRATLGKVAKGKLKEMAAALAPGDARR
jgi:crotonobetaine/carnitine-CoA ligase